MPAKDKKQSSLTVGIAFPNCYHAQRFNLGSVPDCAMLGAQGHLSLLAGAIMLHLVNVHNFCLLRCHPPPIDMSVEVSFSSRGIFIPHLTDRLLYISNKNS